MESETPISERRRPHFDPTEAGEAGEAGEVGEVGEVGEAGEAVNLLKP